MWRRRSKKLPTSGYEEMFDELKWADPVVIENNNCYSYALGDYSRDRPDKAIPGDAHPKRYKFGIDYRDCKDIKKRLIDDNPPDSQGKQYIYAEVAEKPCAKGFYKIMLFLTDDRGDDNVDFHFYKQSKDLLYQRKSTQETNKFIADFFGVPLKTILYVNPKLHPESTTVGEVIYVPNANIWTHKRGFGTKALYQDASGKRIDDPRYADRDYSKEKGGGLNYTKYCGSFCVRAGQVTSSTIRRKMLNIIRKKTVKYNGRKNGMEFRYGTNSQNDNSWKLGYYQKRLLNTKTKV